MLVEIVSRSALIAGVVVLCIGLADCPGERFPAPGGRLPENSWTYGGSGSDAAHAVQQTSDGGYVLAGYYTCYQPEYRRQMYLVKTDGDGQQLWDRTYGGDAETEAYAVAQTSDGGFVLAGYTYAPHYTDIYLVRVDASGGGLWKKPFGGDGWQKAFAVAQTSDGGFVLAGYNRSAGHREEDAYLVKVDVNGSLVWERTLGRAFSDEALAMDATSDGGFILAGRTNSFSARDDDMYLVRTDSEGNLLWEKAYGSDDWDVAEAVRQTSDGGYILAGRTRHSEYCGVEAYLVKVDSNGDLEWDRTFGDVGDDRAFDVQQTSDGGYILVGYAESYVENRRSFDVYLVKTDASGRLLWERTYGGDNWDEGRSVQQTDDGGYIVAGRSESFNLWDNYDSDMYMIKVDANGNLPSGR